MKIKRNLLRWLSPALLLAAFTLQAETIPFDLEVGYRWFKVHGNEQMYRTQVNERSGLLIRNFNLATSDFNGGTRLFDRFRVDVSDMGTGPAGMVRIEANKAQVYRLRLNYRMADDFSSLPAFANPFFDQGIIPGQHTFDRRRRMFNADLDFLPESRITPFIGFTSNTNSGPGETTYHLGQDEFQLRQNLDEKDREFRAGVGFRFPSIYGQVTQGWRKFTGEESLTLASGAGSGNNLDPILGTPISATDITRKDKTNVDTPFTNVYVTGEVMKRARLIGSYSRFAADGDGTESESAAGSFVSFAISRFFSGLAEQASSKAKNTTSRAGARAEVTLAPHLDFLASVRHEKRELDGSALLTTLYLQAITFGGLDKTDIQTILNAKNSLDRKQDAFDVAFSAHSVGPFAFRLGYSETKDNIVAAPDLSEIVVPGNQSGEFTRIVHTLELNGTYRHAGFMAGATLRRDRADDPIFRTDFLDRDRWRVRGGWTSPKEFIRLGVTAERTSQSNNQSDIDSDARIRQYSGDVELTPIAAIKIHGSMSGFRSDSSALYRLPQNFTLGRSIHLERGVAREGGFTVLHAPASLEASVARFSNDGSLPFDIERFHVRLTYDLKSKTGVAAEYDRDTYDESAPGYGNFAANRYGIYLRWRP